MENTRTPLLAVSDFIALSNQTLEFAFGSVAIEGELSGFKINQAKYVFFDLKDERGSIGCFMTVWQLRQPIEDGMKVIVTATPKLTDWGKFSLTVKTIRPSGKGDLKRSLDLLQEKLAAEGLFRPERKRLLPKIPQYIGVISSTQAAGYADFIKIINDRWGDLKIDVAHVQVQGREAPDQIIRALKYFNAKETPPEVIAIIRGGGSLDDLSTFNDELLVREIAASRAPTLVGVGHETDTTLSDLAADVRAATPSNAAQLVVPDKAEVLRHIQYRMAAVASELSKEVDRSGEAVVARLQEALGSIIRRQEAYATQLEYRKQVLSSLDPKNILARGYAMVRGDMSVGSSVEIETNFKVITAEVKYVTNK